MVFLVVENENRQLEDLPQADFGRVHEKISFVGKEKVNNWEFCKKKATPIVCFCNGSTHIFILSVIADALHAFFFFRGLWNLYKFCARWRRFLMGLRIFLYPTNYISNFPHARDFVPFKFFLLIFTSKSLDSSYRKMYLEMTRGKNC